MRYGQVTTTFRFGGAGIWSPRDQRQYAVHPEEVTRSGVRQDTFVSFVIDDSCTWAERVTPVELNEMPDDVADALADTNLEPLTLRVRTGVLSD